MSYTAPACAQTVWIVDQANGPGTHFTSVAPAISAAAGGDHVRIRAGSYVENALDVDKSLSIVGEPGVSITLNVLGSAGLTIHDLPASAPFAMRGLRIGGQLAGPPILVRDCAG
ncbi:MAG: hypothetical protein KAI24_20070, partial [Planctomycetes bacterium]|nr:hypothetical protein [Planctomycetota bacterium]